MNTETPDIITTSQFNDTRRRGDALNGEQKLMLAVLVDALNKINKRKDHTEILAWFKNPSSKLIFSFENICDHLGLEASNLRREVCRPEPERPIKLQRRSPITIHKVA